MFNRIKPCKSCPFRTNKHAVRFLGERRAREIVDSLLGDQSFTCHDDLDLPQSDRQHCVGAMLMLEKIDRPNQIMRIGERIRLYDRNKLVGHAEVFDDFDDWIEQQSMHV